MSVVIPHYEDPVRLRSCLEALSHAPHARSGEVEIVVVDNGSTADLSWISLDYPFARLVVEETRGAASARNRGVADTHAPRIAFLDSDCIPESTWLERALTMPLLPQGEVVGGAVHTFDETAPPRSGAEAFETVFAFQQKDYVERKGFTVTANMVFDRALFERVGPLRDEVSEDVEWCARARAAGARITYDPDLAVSHPTRQDWPSLRKKWLRTTCEAYGSGRERPLPWIAKALMLPVSAAVHAPKALFAPDLHGLQERLACLTTLVRLRWARGVWMMILVAGRTPR